MFYSQLKRLQDDEETMWKKADPEVKQVYGRKYLESQFSGLDRAADTSYRTTTPVIDAFVDAVTLENPSTRYLVDGGRGLVDKYCVGFLFFPLHYRCKCCTGYIPILKNNLLSISLNYYYLY